MARVVLTEHKCRTLKPGPRRRFLLDVMVPGLVLSITTQGYRSFMLRARWPNGKHKVRRVIGECGAISLEAARTQARLWLELLRQGLDPQLELKEQQRKVAAERGLTFAAVADAYIADRLRGKRQGARGAREIRAELTSHWGGRPITSISRADIINLIDDLKARARRNVGVRSSGAFARIVYSHARSIFSWAALRFDLERSPCDRLSPHSLGLIMRSRQRTLNDAEIAALWRVCDDTSLGYPFGSYVRVLLMTGCRRSEVSGARWSEIDLAAKVWTIPRSRAKSDAEHIVPLTDDLVALLAGLPRFRSGDHVFTTTFGKTSIAGFSKYTARLLACMRAELGADMPGFTLHDLRRTFRSRLSEIGISERVAERCIGHGPRDPLVRIYDRYGYTDEIKSAVEAWHRRLRSIVEPAPLNVVPLPLRA